MEREWTRVFRRWSGRFLGGALAEIYEHVEGDSDGSATILDLARTSLRFDAASQPSTELYHVFIMLTMRTSRAVGAQGGRAGGPGSVSTSPPAI